MVAARRRLGVHRGVRQREMDVVTPAVRARQPEAGNAGGEEHGSDAHGPHGATAHPRVIDAGAPRPHVPGLSDAAWTVEERWLLFGAGVLHHREPLASPWRRSCA